MSILVPSSVSSAKLRGVCVGLCQFRPGACADGGIAGIDDLLAEAAFRLDAQAITGLSNEDPVSQWDDESGADNHAVQATGASQPLYRTDLWDDPVVRFDGSDDYIVSPYALDPLVNYTICGVYSRHGTFGENLTIQLRDGTSTGDPVLGFYATGATSGNFQGAMVFTRYSSSFNSIRGDRFGTMTQAVNQRCIIQGGRSGTDDGSSFYRYNGADQEYVSSSTLSGVGDAEAVGATVIGRINTNERFQDIAEILIFEKVLSSDEMDLIDTYLADKWGISL